MTCRQLQTASRQLASALLKIGIVCGDHVGIWSHNNSEWLLLQLATAQVGIILVNINPAYLVSALEYALNKVSCKVLVTMTSNYLEMLRMLTPELTTCAPGQLQAVRLPTLTTVVQLDRRVTRHATFRRSDFQR